MVLIVKAMVLVYGALSFQITIGERVRTLTHMLSIWNRWDGPQYLLIAQHGYGVAGDQRLALGFFRSIRGSSGSSRSSCAIR